MTPPEQVVRTQVFPSAPGPVRSLADVVRTRARDLPDATALECSGDRLTWAELRDRSASVAAALLAEGVRSGSRVAVLARNGLPVFEITFGAAMLNAVCVPVNWRLSDHEVRDIVEDSEATVVVVEGEFAPLMERIVADLRHVRRVVVIGRHARWTAYESWMGDHQATDPGIVAGREDVALQLYTSGTTGAPKGVMLTNGNLFSMLEGMNRWFGFNAQDSVNLAAMPLFHIGGIGWSLFGLAFGCRTFILRDVVTRDIVASMRRGVTHAFVVPAIIQAILAEPGVSREDFLSMRKLAYGASPISESVLTRAIELFGCDLIQLYGMTETTGAIVQLDAADHDPVGRPNLLRSCGRRYPWVEVRIVRPDGADADEGEVGELWVRSSQVMAGYWRKPEATAEAITPSGWFKTGDAGYRDGAGYLYLYDRVKDMIITGAENVYPAEVENVVMAHPGVADVAVVGVPDERWGEAVKAVVVAATDPPPDPADIIAFCHERIAGFKCPKSVDFVDTLPRNASGKLLKREIRAPYWAGADRFIG